MKTESLLSIPADPVSTPLYHLNPTLFLPAKPSPPDSSHITHNPYPTLIYLEPWLAPWNIIPTITPGTSLKTGHYLLSYLYFKTFFFLTHHSKPLSFITRFPITSYHYYPMLVMISMLNMPLSHLHETQKIKNGFILFFISTNLILSVYGVLFPNNRIPV